MENKLYPDRDNILVEKSLAYASPRVLSFYPYFVPDETVMQQNRNVIF